jgi:hypothetical protein
MLDDGTYDAVVVDADAGATPGLTRVELAIAAGEHKGEVVSISTDEPSIVAREPLDLLALPATLTVVDGRPSLVIEG